MSISQKSDIFGNKWRIIPASPLYLKKNRRIPTGRPKYRVRATRGSERLKPLLYRRYSSQDLQWG